MTSLAFTDRQQIDENPKVDFVDTVVVNLKVSPRELKLMCDALIESDRYMCQEGKLQSPDLHRWDCLLDYIKEKAFNDAY